MTGATTIESAPLRQRQAARTVVIDPRQQILLFRFDFTRGALAGRSSWALPGGGIEEGETPQQAAIRELREETGIIATEVGTPIGELSFRMRLPSGEVVDTTEFYFLVRTPAADVSYDGWTKLETEIIAEHRWWTIDEIRTTTERVYPVTLLAMLQTAGVVAKQG